MRASDPPARSLAFPKKIRWGRLFLFGIECAHVLGAGHVQNNILYMMIE
jgi:hypothetical protein